MLVWLKSILANFWAKPQEPPSVPTLCSYCAEPVDIEKAIVCSLAPKKPVHKTCGHDFVVYLHRRREKRSHVWMDDHPVQYAEIGQPIPVTTQFVGYKPFSWR